MRRAAGEIAAKLHCGENAQGNWGSRKTGPSATMDVLQDEEESLEIRKRGVGKSGTITASGNDREGRSGSRKRRAKDQLARLSIACDHDTLESEAAKRTPSRRGGNDWSRSGKASSSQRLDHEVAFGGAAILAGGV